MNKYIFGMIAVFVLIQFVPVSRDNPAIERDVDAPLMVKQILKKSCYDCHSHETQWPRYSYVAPVSWMIVHDVHEARQQVNFSRWGRYSPEHRAYLIGKINEEVEEGGMPLPQYLWLHSSARLSEEDKQVLSEWGKKE